MIQSIANGGDGKKDVSTVVDKLKMIENGQNPNETDGRMEVAVAIAEPNQELTVHYDEFERTVIGQSQEQGFHTYEISISFT